MRDSSAGKQGGARQKKFLCPQIKVHIVRIRRREEVLMYVFVFGDSTVMKKTTEAKKVLRYVKSKL